MTYAQFGEIGLFATDYTLYSLGQSSFAAPATLIPCLHDEV